MSATDGYFMNIGGIDGAQSKSFEEVRVHDYMWAYSNTGGPPLPCPEQPAEDQARLLLSLPPLFKPYPIPSVPTDVQKPPIPPSKVVVNPLELPAAQAFQTTTSMGETFHSIVAMQEYSGFSHEELRYYAYLKGHIMPPTPVPLDSFAAPVATSNRSPSPSSKPPYGTETMAHICAQPRFSGHSPEELRIAFILAGREVDSATLSQMSGLAPPAASTSLSRSIPLPSQTATLPPAPTFPSFTFNTPQPQTSVRPFTSG